MNRPLRRYQGYFNSWIYDRSMTQVARIVMRSLKKGDDTPGDALPPTDSGSADARPQNPH